MLPDIGKQIQRLPRTLRLVRDLEQFEGPILSEYHAAEGGVPYLEKWCTQDEAGTVHRFLLVRSDLRSIAQYMAKRVSMAQLLQDRSDGIGFLIDRSRNEQQAKLERIALVALEELPPGYMPEEDTYHDEALRPRWQRTVQSFLLGPDWSGEQISAIERSYLDAAAFNYFTAVNSDAETGIPDRVLKFAYRRGYPVGAAFKVLRGNMPHEQRGRSAGVAAGSPGVLSIDVGTTTAENLIKSMRLLGGAKPLYDLVQHWARQDIQGSPAIPDNAADHLAWLAESLDLNLARFGDPGEHAHAIGKLLTAYFRKLTRLARPPGDAELLGVERAAVPVDVFVTADDDD